MIKRQKNGENFFPKKQFYPLTREKNWDMICTELDENGKLLDKILYK